MLNYAAAIEKGSDRTAWGVVIPDLPGCFSAGDTLDAAIAGAREAALAWIDAVLDDGGEIPRPRSLEEHYANPEFDGWTWAIVAIDTPELDQTIERVNVTLARRVLARLDRIARETGESRSGAIARLALEAHV